MQGSDKNTAPETLPIPRNKVVNFIVGAEWNSDTSHFYVFDNLDEIAGGSKAKDVRDKMYGDFKPSEVNVIITCNLDEKKLEDMYKKLGGEEAGSKK